MRVSIGSRLGPYEIVSLLGEGGMGQVFEATDTRLQRRVAIKVLNDSFARDERLRARFQREAKTISLLNHPHICSVYDVGHEDGTDFLVLELIEGESLASRLARGPLPLEQALRFGSQIAEALERAHAAGVVHRDLKPGNIMITNTGAKLLDFGLAKSSPLESSSDGETEVHPLTEEGAVLGTPQYMAPEQISGGSADARTDIFALGLVLYEMVTGRRAFTATSRAALIAAIVSTEPVPLSAVPSVVPAAVEILLARCLAKDPHLRWQCAGDLKHELARIGGAPAIDQRTGGGRRGLRLAWSVATAALLAALLLAAMTLRPSKTAGAVRFTVTPPPGWTISIDLNLGPPAVSPDGRSIAFSATNDVTGRVQLWVRDLDSTESFALAGTERAGFVFWSPDSRTVGFFADGYLKRTDVHEGAPQAICPTTVARGGSWSPNDVILFAPTADGPLFRVPASGGTPQPVTKLDKSRGEISHRWPHFLPDGEHFLFLIRTPAGDDRHGDEIHSASLDAPEPRLVLAASSNIAYSEPGYLLYMRNRMLLAQRFNLRTREVEGTPSLVTRDTIQQHGAGFGIFSCSRDGVLAMGAGQLVSSLLWLNRDGGTAPAIPGAAEYASARLGAGGTQILYGLPDPTTGSQDLWLYDIERQISRRLTSHRRDDLYGTLTSDGTRLMFSSNRFGTPDLFVKSLDAAEERLLFPSSSSDFAEALSPDGRMLLFRRIDPKTRDDIMSVAVAGGAPAPFIKTEFAEMQPAFEPGGKWVAYTSDESGRNQVYLIRYPEATSRVQISIEGGAQPTWRGDGKELFYLAPGDRIVAVPIDLTSGAPRLGTAAELLRLPLRMGRNPERQYDVSPDGQRFLMNVMPGERRSLPLTVALHWQDSFTAPK